ncbi:MAG: HD domain-containing protein [Acidobacteria bacterium]|nr:HD domain-containing protein [Acidobacteriota bacterium]
MKEAVEVRLASAASAEQLITDRSTQVDAIVRASFSLHLGSQFPQGVAAIAVGGYGRRELFPHSDVDVMILAGKQFDGKGLREPVGRFLKDLWDAGLRMSHSVHNVDECCQFNDQNVELTISLLDRRPLAGDSDLITDLGIAMPRFYKAHGATISRHLARISRSRHSKFSNTIYHLEPNIKETPGGLRDVQVCRWLAKLVPGRQIPDLDPVWKFLAPIRLFLHEASRRDNNLLSFDMQDAMSANPGAMMRDYFRQARAAFAAASEFLDAVEESQPSLIRQFRDWRSRLSNSEFTVSRDRVYLRSSGLLQADPDAVWRLLEFTARHGVPAAKELEQKLAAALPELTAHIARTPVWPKLRAVLSLPKASYALRIMQHTGLMAALFPEWAHIDCLVVRDFYHRYTVDEHTIVTLETLENLADPRYKELLGEVEHIALIRMALLFHDSGKGTGREHSAESVRIVQQEVAPRIGLAGADLQAVLKLIEGHLLLSVATTSRDLDDEHTGLQLADQLGTVEQLKMLTLVTYADISAVNPTAMSPWRADQLWRTYLISYQELTSELETARIRSFGADPATSAFLEGLPARYLRTHTMEQVEAHVAMAARAAREGAAVELVRSNGYWQAVVATIDRPGLFASIAGALASFGLNILKAEAFANSSGIILDSFVFSDPLRNLDLNPSEIDRLNDTLLRVILGKVEVKKLLAGRRPLARHPQVIEPRVAFNNRSSTTATLIEIVAEDRPGLLYDLASTMSKAGCDIVVVLIDTEVNKALDVFYVTMSGAKVDGEREAALRTALLEVCSVK